MGGQNNFNTTNLQKFVRVAFEQNIRNKDSDTFHADPHNTGTTGRAVDQCVCSGSVIVVVHQW